ncbi:MAG TPA: VanZ family protein [Terracidiphilus sp.]|nr:VanZ family protein [Terracidiphilus sp.]
MDSAKPRQRDARPWLYAWWPVILGTALIAFTSSNLFSSADTSGPFRWVYEHIFGQVSDWRWRHIHFFIRKSMHFFGYGAFGILWLRAWWLTLPRSTFLQDTMLAVLGAGLVAGADELHQRFLTARTGSPFDVLIDCAGAFTLQLLLFAILRIFRPQKLVHQA